ncbi:exocyst complex component EXO70I-like [Andrographis paniculata]|uniref:exocyst complex component EXO70I-like n=1 Tax=Andrographis paniculata TaxID=175694 RepID=UPI0021E7A222|nr:exocyst complex component EXO70I-like [Andrographis paniculata]
MAQPIQNDVPNVVSLHSACHNLKNLIKESIAIDASYNKINDKFEAMHQTLNLASKRVAPLQSLSIANKALDARITRAVAPALSLLAAFKIFESLQHKLLRIASKLPSDKRSYARLEKLVEYIDCVDKLNESIASIGRECEPAIQKLQEVVEFLSRTKATDHYQTRRLRETLLTLKAVCETEIVSMKFEGLLDDALLNLQDEYEKLLQKLKHRNIGDPVDDDPTAVVEPGLGTELEIEVLSKISRMLTANDCLDICIDMFVKVRYRRAAKALMRLNPEYLKTYTPENIDEMDWESLETAIALWIDHFELAVKTVFVSEKDLCRQVLGNVMAGAIWPECFVKVADKIMAVFFRFGEGVARSTKEPQKLFKLLEMFDSLEKLKPEFSEVFDGDAGVDICSRFRELEKLLIHSSSRVFFEFGLQIEGNIQDSLLPPQDGSVPKLVRYAVNYLNNLTTEGYSATMAQVLKTEQLWKAGILSNPENEQDLLRDAVLNVVEAIQRNVDSKKSRYKDKIAQHIFAMNTFWYIYMRSRNTELGKLLGEPHMKKRFRYAAEESAYLYQKQAWGGLVRLLDIEDVRMLKDGRGGLVRGKIEAFMTAFDDMCQKHRTIYKIVSDADLRAQMKEATVKLVVPAYADFYDAYSQILPRSKTYPSPEKIEDLIGEIFEGSNGKSNTRKDRRSLDRQQM